jgi:hypothetical protein
MGIKSLVASSPQEYVSLALKVTHNSQFRSRVVSRILANNYRLFNDRLAISQWDKFLTAAVARSNKGFGKLPRLGASTETVAVPDSIVGRLKGQVARTGGVGSGGRGNCSAPPAAPSSLEVPLTTVVDVSDS